jgi:heat shock protein HslJ/membrane-bound inhibitor of C-type lysozyme
MYKIGMICALTVMLAACGQQKQEDNNKAAAAAAQVQAAASTTTAFYNCGEHGVKAIYRGDDQLKLTHDGQDYDLGRVVSASGARYETAENATPAIQFWSKGREAFMEIDGQQTPTCHEISETDSSAEFYQARGNEPFWRVDLDADSVTLDMMDQDKITWAKPTAEIKERTTVYHLQNEEQGHAVLTIESMPKDKPCQDGMSGQYYADTVTLDRDKQILSGCGGAVQSLQKEKDSNAASVEDPEIKLELGKNEWLVEDINEKGLIDNTQLTLSFDEKENRLYGTSGCNRYFGNYTIDGYELKIHPALGATMMACHADAIMNQERAYLDLLPTMTEAVITNDGFLILSNDKDEFIRFSAK